MNRLDFLIDYLIKEDPQYSEMEIPTTEQGKRDLFRALRNVREPKPVSEEFLRLQDEELQAQLQEKGIVEWVDIMDVGRDAPWHVSTERQNIVSGFGQRREHPHRFQNSVHPMDDAKPECHLRHRQPRRGIHRGPDQGQVDCDWRGYWWGVGKDVELLIRWSVYFNYW